MISDLVIIYSLPIFTEMSRKEKAIYTYLVGSNTLPILREGRYLGQGEGVMENISWYG